MRAWLLLAALCPALGACGPEGGGQCLSAEDPNCAEDSAAAKSYGNNGITPTEFAELGASLLPPTRLRASGTPAAFRSRYVTAYAQGPTQLNALAYFASCLLPAGTTREITGMGRAVLLEGRFGFANAGWLAGEEALSDEAWRLALTCAGARVNVRGAHRAVALANINLAKTPDDAVTHEEFAHHELVVGINPQTGRATTCRGAGRWDGATGRFEPWTDAQATTLNESGRACGVRSANSKQAHTCETAKTAPTDLDCGSSCPIGDDGIVRDRCTIGAESFEASQVFSVFVSGP